jgi:hypothetical protein
MRRTLTIIAAALILGVSGTLIAQAAIPDAQGVFTACINKTSGAVRIIDTSTTQRCASNEIRRTWNAQGQPGTNGTDGASGVSGYEVVKVTRTDVDFSGTVGASAVAECPDGKVVTGGGGAGGYSVGLTPGFTLDLQRSYPTNPGAASGVYTAWTVELRSPEPGRVFPPQTTGDYAVWAMCIDATP